MSAGLHSICISVSHTGLRFSSTESGVFTKIHFSVMYFRFFPEAEHKLSVYKISIFRFLKKKIERHMSTLDNFKFA